MFKEGDKVVCVRGFKTHGGELKEGDIYTIDEAFDTLVKIVEPFWFSTSTKTMWEPSHFELALPTKPIDEWL